MVCMPEHVWVDLEPNLGFVAGPGEQLGEARRGERTTLRGEDKGARLTGASAPACWFNRRCRGGEHTAQEVLSCNRSLGND